MQYFADGSGSSKPPSLFQVGEAIQALSRLDDATEKLIKKFEMG